MDGFGIWLIVVAVLITLTIQYFIITYAVENGIRRSKEPKTAPKNFPWADKPPEQGDQ